jgi:hypothetical protein
VANGFVKYLAQPSSTRLLQRPDDSACSGPAHFLRGACRHSGSASPRLPSQDHPTDLSRSGVPESPRDRVQGLTARQHVVIDQHAPACDPSRIGDEEELGELRRCGLLVSQGARGVQKLGRVREQRGSSQGIIRRWPCPSSTSWHAESPACCLPASKARTPKTSRLRSCARHQRRRPCTGPVVGRVMLALTWTCFGAVGRVPRCAGSCSTVCAPTAAAATPGRRNEGASVGGHLGHGWVSGTRSGCSWAVWCWTWSTRRRRAEDH